MSEFITLARAVEILETIVYAMREGSIDLLELEIYRLEREIEGLQQKTPDHE